MLTAIRESEENYKKRAGTDQNQRRKIKIPKTNQQV